MNKDKKQINITDLRELTRKISNQKSMWQNGLLFASIFSTIILLASLFYLFLKPIAPDVKKTIDREVSSSNINFDKKTLEEINNRQQPPKPVEPNVGKNPFLAF